MSVFQKATKRAVKARVAFDGPSGSGKTWTALTWGQVLGGRIALIDTERGSASLYSDRFDFDVLEIAPPYDPQRLVDALKAAEAERYDVLIVDSFSHFWEGEGGVLDIADAAGQRAQGNSWAGWKSATPVLRHVIDTMLGLDAHLIVTMRSKTEWTQEEYADSKGHKRTRPVRVGMAPVMRAGVEYELTVVGDLDLEHRLSITKSRCDTLADIVVQPGRAHEAAETFLNWTRTGAQVADRNEIDSLRQRVNKIEPPDVRRACTQAFRDAFGNPDNLLAAKLDEAKALVSGYETKQKPPEEPAGDVGTTGGTAEPEPATSTQQEAALPSEVDRKRWAKEIHTKATKLKVSDVDLDLILLNATVLRTEHADQITGGEATTVLQMIDAAGKDPGYMQRIREAVGRAQAEADDAAAEAQAS